MLLAVSILSILVAGFFSYRSGSQSLTTAAYDQLTSVRDARSNAINSFFTGLKRSVVLNSLNATSTQAMTELTAGYEELNRASVTPADQRSIDAYYNDVFLPELRKNADGEVTADSFEPRSNAQRYLQARYTTQTDDFDEAIKVDDAGDGSAWSAAHAKYHNFFREVVLQNNFEDAMLVDPDGNVVYTAYKGVDLGTNLLTGPYRDSQLTTSYREVLRSNTTNAVAITDFEPYTPSYDVPTAFGLSPIGSNGKLLGVLVVQLPVSSINATMTAGGQWASAGLGATGESYLVGPDQTMRSTSRPLLEDPAAYRAAAVGNGTPPALADRIVEEQNPILRQPIRSGSVTAGLRGQTGTEVETDYLGRQVLTSYAPVAQDGVNWVVVAQIDEAEALRPVQNLLRTLALTTLAVVLAVTLASILLARAFSRPVSQLVDGVRRVAAGELGAKVSMRRRDEFNDLANAFNDMSSSLATKQELLDAQMAENDRMLRNLMPDTVAKRYRGGEKNIVEEHHNVSVLYATLEGFDEFSIGRTPTESIELLNELVRGFDAAADQTGVERVRTLRSGYIASCGLVVPRVDHAVRMLDFARELANTVARFSAQHGADLRLRIGIDTGMVTSGLVGGSAVYDMWGDSVTLAYRVQSAENEPGIYITQHLYDLVRDAAAFEPAETVSAKGAEQPVWRLKEAVDG